MYAANSSGDRLGDGGEFRVACGSSLFSSASSEDLVALVLPRLKDAFVDDRASGDNTDRR